jgi:hypothetical protein
MPLNSVQSQPELGTRKGTHRAAEAVLGLDEVDAILSDDAERGAEREEGKHAKAHRREIEREKV